MPRRSRSRRTSPCAARWRRRSTAPTSSARRRPRASRSCSASGRPRHARQRRRLLDADGARARRGHGGRGVAVRRPSRVDAERVRRLPGRRRGGRHRPGPHPRRARRAAGRRPPGARRRRRAHAVQVARPRRRGPRRRRAVRRARRASAASAPRSSSDPARAHRGGARAASPTSRCARRSCVCRCRVAPREIWLKLECLQPIGSFKLRGAANAIRSAGARRDRSRRGLDDERRQHGPGRGLDGPGATASRRRSSCPTTRRRRSSTRSSGSAARVDQVPFERWWQAMEEGAFPVSTGSSSTRCMDER